MMNFSIDFLISLGGLLLALAILVTVHEFGHFWVARKAGVKVLRFSVGFGQPIWTKVDKHGTEFAVAWIPLGGYVKMLDETEGPVSDDVVDQAFNRKKPIQKIAIALAGPMANFLFAILAFSLMYMIGTRQLLPIVDAPFSESPAMTAQFERGDIILEVDGSNISNFSELGLAVASRVGDSGEIEFTVDRNGRRIQTSIFIDSWLANEQTPEPLRSLGLRPKFPVQAVIIGNVVPEGAAERDGLMSGDEIISANSEIMESWNDWVLIIQQHPNKPLEIVVNRNNQNIKLFVTPNVREVNGVNQGYIGAAAKPMKWPKDQLITLRHWPITAVVKGFDDTVNMIDLSVQMLWKMASGKISLKQIGGPISIAQMAGLSVKSGFESFVGFLALISISLGIVNLLPIPVLDGGHVVIHSFEWLRGKPLSEKAQIIGMQLGMVFILALMSLAFINDIGRIL